MKVLNEKFSIKREEYTKLTSKEKAEIGKRASEHGIASTIRHLAKKYPNLMESSVRTWKSIYLAEVRCHRTCQEILTITELPEKKTERPLLLGNQLEFEVIHYLLQLVPLKEAFSALVHLLRIALTICVTTAKCERTFSCLKLLKNYLRSTMSQSKLNDLAAIAVESDIAKNFY